MAGSKSFLQNFIGRKSQPDEVDTAKASDVEGQSSDGIGREFEELENSLQVLSGIPVAFQHIVSNFNKVSKELDNVRERVRVSDDVLKAERGRVNDLVNQLELRKTDLERSEYGLQRAQAGLSAKRERNTQLESMLSDLRLANAEANSKLARLEPLARELKAETAALTARIEGYETQKDQITKENLEFRDDLIRSKEEIAKLKERTNTLVGERQSFSERLDQSANTIVELNTSIAADREKIAALVARAKRESIVTRALRNENDQLIKEREDLRAESANQLEASRSRYRVLERLLEDSRVRFQAEAHTTNTLRREKNLRENDLAQSALGLTTARDEVTELRAQLLTLTEAATSARADLAAEAETRMKLDIELQVAREANAKLESSIKSTAIDKDNDRQLHDTLAAESKATIEALRAENERLRSELQVYRYVGKTDSEGGDEDFTGGVVVNLKH